MNLVDRIINRAMGINEAEDLQKKIPERYSFLYRDVTKFITPDNKWKAIKAFERFRNGPSKPNYKINPQMLIFSKEAMSNGTPKVIKLNNVYYAIDGFQTPEPNRLQSNVPIDVRLLNCDEIKIGQSNQSNFDFEII